MKSSKSTALNTSPARMDTQEPSWSITIHSSYHLRTCDYLEEIITSPCKANPVWQLTRHIHILCMVDCDHNLTRRCIMIAIWYEARRYWHETIDILCRNVKWSKDWRRSWYSLSYSMYTFIDLHVCLRVCICLWIYKQKHADTRTKNQLQALHESKNELFRLIACDSQTRSQEDLADKFLPHHPLPPTPYPQPCHSLFACDMSLYIYTTTTTPYP